MVAKSITKLLDEAIVPAVALIIGKMIGLLAVAYFFHLSFTLDTNSFLKFLPSISFRDTSSYILAENYSNLAMFMAAAFGTLLVTVRAHFFHQSHIHPRLHAQMVKLNLEKLIAPSYHLYHQAAIWLTYLWLSVGFLIISSLLGITFLPITVVAFIVATNFTWVFALDVQKEVEISRS